MNTNIRAIILCLLFVVSATAQKKGKVLIKVDGEPSYQAEFVRLFAKNRGIDSDNSKESLEKDLQLFIDYKLKLIEASKLGLDTVTEYKEEVKRYRNQLALPYLTDNKYIDGLVKKVYERSLKEVKASHILILVDENEKDTIKAYEKITALRNKAINGADFGVLAQENSEDRSAKQNKGDLGYFSVFRMVHQFEDAAFSTPVGAVSKIFRTRFGFHILKVEDIRDSKGEVEVAHIMIRDTTSVGKATIDKVEQEVINGGVFEQLAEKYSDDRRTATNGGKMPKFAMGSMPAPFDTESFLLSKENPYSKPFRTDYGWHFVKFINHYPVPSFEASKKELESKVKSDDRSKSLANPIVEKLKKTYKIKINEAAKKEFEDQANFAKMDSINKWLVVIEKDTLRQKNFFTYLNNRRDKQPLAIFNDFLDEKILDNYKANLENTSPAFKNLFQEYKNGLLLFDLMKLKVWDVAQNDSIGLQKHYDLNMPKYISKGKITAIVVRSKNKSELDAIKNVLTSNEAKNVEELLAENKGVIVKSGEFEKDDLIFPSATVFEKGISEYKDKDGSFVLVKISEIGTDKQESFEDVKGKVMSDYQDEIQKNWMDSLNKSHKIKVYKRTLKSSKKLMDNYKNE